ncbi:MAG: glycosyl hydrolase 115 family protein [Bacteroidota bacterium]|nr:glycosyl hydrolase 115 family protein [Bacteroidota bacterium]
MHKKIFLSSFLVAVLLLISPHRLSALVGEKTYVSAAKHSGDFTLAVSGKNAPLCVSSRDFPGVLLIAKQLQQDIENVTKATPELFSDTIPSAKEIVLIGTLGKNPLIDQLVESKKLDVHGIAGQWETFLLQTIEKPFPNVVRALVIAGSDKRGTIYGMFDLSEHIGISPWYWWADVPVKKNTAVYITHGRHTSGPPSVKYRGIFLNDEWPDLTEWVKKKFGAVRTGTNPPVPPGVANYGHEFYERIFELLLRLKANYLWPAMWNNAFNEDDSLNAKLADEYGIVMGTSHQEPMLRAQKEWDRRYLNTLGTWNYAAFPDTMENFWRESIRRNKNYESIITIGLRGANDTPMAPGGPEANMALLKKIIDGQRNIIAGEVNPDVTKVPQLWCPYKEVLDFYNAGFRVPDDVTILWTDDNWGNIRRLPTPEERKRSGGAGIYYHFDYHGGPRNYQWINTNPIAKISDQMSLAKEYGADRIWIVNVGHLKGYELPISYFMDLAWNTNRWTNENVNEYTRLWAEQQFSPNYAAGIADILSKYTKYNGRRKPELLSPTTYSQTNYREADNIVSEFKAITGTAEKIYNNLPEDEKDAFYELVLFPTKASEVLNELYNAAGKNALYARQGRASTNDMAHEVDSLFQTFTSLMGYFDHTFANGKWNHFMDQPVLGYRGWNQPQKNTLDAIHLAKITIPDSALMGVAVEGSSESWPGSKTEAALPEFDPFNRQSLYVDIFNRGKIPFEYSIKKDKPWIRLSSLKGRIEKQLRLWVTVEWKKVPNRPDSGTFTVIGTGRTIPVKVKVFSPKQLINSAGVQNARRVRRRTFIESNGVVSIDADHYSHKKDNGTYRWIEIENYGRTSSAMRTTSALNAPAPVLGTNSPCLEYSMFLFDTGTVDVEGIFSPTLNFFPGRGLRYAISFDNETPQIIALVPEDYNAQNGNRDWELTVANSARYSHAAFRIAEPGYHTVKIWMIDPGVVLEKIVANCGGIKTSYLGPPESFREENDSATKIQEHKKSNIEN